MKQIRFMISIVLVMISIGCGSSSCSRGADSIIVSYAPFQTLALLWIADEQGFFSRYGLDVTLREYDTGAGSVDGVLNGEADIAVGPAEFPFVGKTFRKERIRIIGSLDKVEHIAVVARKDRGIREPSDLKGKTVGTTLGTVAEFYLGRFLMLNGISMHDIKVVDLKTPPEWVNAVVEGKIDAVVTAQPSANLARDRLGPNAIVWSAQSNQPMYALIIATEKWIETHPGMVTRFLKSLIQAEEYIIRNPAEAKAILQKRLNLTEAVIETVWSQNQYGLSIDQSLITAMEDEARWMIDNNLTPERQVPNFLDYIYEDALKKIKPESVNIIR